MDKRRTIVLVLRTSKEFTFKDVELITRHINGKWKSKTRPCIVCLWDKVTECFDLGNMELIPLPNEYPGTWSRMELYSPDMEQYRPFLYVDLDTVIVESLENIFDLVKDPSMFIPLEDFYQKGKLATGIAWIPANSKKISGVWDAWKKHNKSIRSGKRMDFFLRQNIEPDTFWQNLTKTIHDFKPRNRILLKKIPKKANVICFHGRPRIHKAAENPELLWVKEYIDYVPIKEVANPEVTVIIPYNKNRGWLYEAIKSVPDGVQLILSKGDGNWPQNFNKALPKAKGKYIRWLHEDDILTKDSLEKAVKAIEKQKVDFIHGNAIEFKQGVNGEVTFRPRMKIMTLKNLLSRNWIHQSTLLYKREVFDKLGGLNENKKYYSFEEFEFNIRCLKAGFKMGYCDEVFAYYRRHPYQIIRTVDKKTRIKYRNELVNEYR